MELLLVVIMPIWPLILLRREVSLYCAVPILADINITRISFDQTDNLSSLIWGLLNQ